MTQTPQSSEAPETADASSESEAPAPSFTPIHHEPPPAKPLGKLLIPVGVAVVVIVGGLIFCRGKPKAAEAKSSMDVSTMSAEELAKNASVPAARELARRMSSGTQAERVAASSAINCWRTPRLTRNLAMAMALGAQKRANEMNVRMRRDQQIARDGP